MEEEIRALLEAVGGFLPKAQRALEAARARGRPVDEAAAAVDRLAALHARMERGVAAMGPRAFAYQAHNLMDLQKLAEETASSSEAAEAAVAALR